MLRPLLVLAGCVALGLAVLWPALGAAWIDDDYAQLGLVRGVQPRPMAAHGPLDAYRFFGGDERDGAALRDRSDVPWWFAPETKMAFFRPATSATMLADAAVGADAREAHAHSMLWLAAVLTTAWLLFRRAVPESAAWATVLLAVSRIGLPAVWWCNRHMLVSGAFGLLAIAAHVAWRRGRMRSGQVLSPVLIALALAGGESGLQAVAYVAAYEILGASDSWRARLAALARPAALVVVYLLAVRALGYGTAHEEVYTDPFADPTRFLVALADHLPATVQRLATAEVDGWTRRVSHGFFLACNAAIDVAWVVLVLRARSLVRTPEGRGATWLLLGALLSLPIILASPAIALTLPLVGTCAAVAVLARGAVRAFRERVTAGSAVGAVAAAVLLLVHGAASPVLTREVIARAAEAQTADHRALVDAALGSDARDVVVLTAPPFSWAWRTGLRLFRPDTHVDHWWPITMITADLDVVRPDAHTLDVSARAGSFLVTHDWLRSAELPLRAGDRIRLSGLEVAVVDASAGDVTRVRLSVARDLDARGVALLAFDGQQLRRLSVPPVGGRIVLRGGVPQPAAPSVLPGAGP